MESQNLAVPRTIVAVDIEGFGGRHRTNRNQLAVRDGLYRAMQQAFGQAAIPWTDGDHYDRGDGMFILIGPEVPKSLFIESLPSALVSALRSHNSRHPDPERIRLRMALHAGEVNYDEHGATAESINRTFRLLESDPLKQELASSQGVLAIITSSWFYEEVVRHTRADAAFYRPFKVAVKETDMTGWVCLPDREAPPGIRPPGAPDDAEGHAAEHVPRQYHHSEADFTARHRRYMWPPSRATQIVTTAVIVVIIALLIVIFLPTRHAPGAVIDDPETADPCALTSATAFSQFGEPTLSTDYGNFNRCDVLVQSFGGNTIDAEVELEVPSWYGSPPPGQAQRAGAVTIFREPGAATECDRTLVLPDHNLVLITAKEPKASRANLCAIAEAATQTALRVLGSTGMPRRPKPFGSASLARRKACSLLDAKALSGVPGIGVGNREPGFADWECRWAGSTDSHVELVFDRNPPLTSGSDGHPIRLHGRTVFVQPGGDGDQTCVALLVYRQYTDETGQPTQELVHLTVGGTGPVTQLCDTATRLADDAAAHLR